MEDVRCPYCDKWNEVERWEGIGCTEDEVFELECRSCEKTFTCTTYISFAYEAEKASCLNGDGHSWENTLTLPKEFAKKRCSICYRERAMGEKERKQYFKENNITPKYLKVKGGEEE